MVDEQEKVVRRRKCLSLAYKHRNIIIFITSLLRPVQNITPISEMLLRSTISVHGIDPDTDPIFLAAALCSALRSTKQSAGAIRMESPSMMSRRLARDFLPSPTTSWSLGQLLQLQLYLSGRSQQR